MLHAARWVFVHLNGLVVCELGRASKILEVPDGFRLAVEPT